MISRPFVFCLTQAGAEAYLKREVSERADGLRPSFSRPGFLTLKSGPTEEFFPATLPRFQFSRVTALSIGKAKSADLAPLKKALADVRVAYPNLELRFHLYARDVIGPEDDPKRDETGAWLAEWRERLAADGDFDGLKWDEEAKLGDGIVHFALVERDEAWLGFSIRREFEWGLPGGKPAIPLPELAPSRAYLKIEEAIRLTGAKLKPGDRAIEVGSAPGGACFALLERGLQVIGIDRGQMDGIVANHPRYTAKLTSIGHYDVRAERPRAEWVLIDMNAEPRVAAKETRPLLEAVLPDLLGVFFTMKVNTEAVVSDLAVIAENLEAKLGLARARIVQLPSNKSEVCFLGFTKKGRLRLPQPRPS